MIIVTAKIEVKPGRKDAFILETKNLISNTRKEEGSISYELYVNTENDNKLVMLELWEDINALNVHVETDHYKKFGSTLEHFLAKEIDVKSYSIKSF
jgi:quinol monooxygenase YgiN